MNLSIKAKKISLGIQAKLLIPFMALIVLLLVFLFIFVHLKFNQQISTTIDTDLQFDKETLQQFFDMRKEKIKSEAMTLSIDSSLSYYLADDFQNNRQGSLAVASRYIQQKSGTLKASFLAVVDSKYQYLAQLNKDNFQVFNFPEVIQRAGINGYSHDIIKFKGEYYHITCVRMKPNPKFPNFKTYLVAGEALNDSFIKDASRFTNGDVALVQWEQGKKPWLHGISDKNLEQSLLSVLNELDYYEDLSDQNRVAKKFSYRGRLLFKDGEASNTFFTISTIDHARYDKERNSLFLILLGTFLVTMILSVYVSLRLAKSLSTPISTLTEGAQRIAEGHLDTQINIAGDDEFARLGRTFNRMATKLKTELEEKLHKAQELRRQTNELKSLNANLDKKLFESSLMLEISNTTNASMDKEKIIRSIIEIVISSFQYRQAELFLLNESGDSVDFYLSREATENHLGIRVYSDKRSSDLIEIPNLTNLVSTCIFQNQTVTGNMLSLDSDGRPVSGFILVPVRAGNKVIGAFQCLRSNFFEGFTADEIESLETIANHMTLSLENLMLHSISNTDSLTQINNVRYFKMQLKKATQTSVMSGRPMAVLIGDVDHFKRFNDTYGHALGDEVLKVVAQTLKSSARESDIPARYGGEEFVMLLPDTGPDEALKVAELVRQNIEHQRVDSAHGPLQVTMSLGVAVCPIHSDEPSELIKLADQALYASKRSGRNRVTLFNENLPKVEEPSAAMESPNDQPTEEVQDGARTTKLPLESPLQREGQTAKIENIQEFEAEADTALIRHPVDQRKESTRTINLEKNDLTKTVPLDLTKTVPLEVAPDKVVELDKTVPLAIENPPLSEDDEIDFSETSSDNQQTATIVPSLDRTEQLLKPDLPDVNDQSETGESFDFSNSTELDSDEGKELDEDGFTLVDDLPPVPSDTVFSKMADESKTSEQDTVDLAPLEKSASKDDEDFDDDQEVTVIDDGDRHAS